MLDRNFLCGTRHSQSDIAFRVNYNSRTRPESSGAAVDDPQNAGRNQKRPQGTRDRKKESIISAGKGPKISVNLELFASPYLSLSAACWAGREFLR